jgi:hypothetical protein
MEELQSASGEGSNIHLHPYFLKTIGDISGLILVVFPKQEHEKEIRLYA